MFDIQENLKKLPDAPGVYLHKDRLGQVIYVGKAVSLKKRVRQYFGSYGKTTAKLRALVSHIAEFEYIRCATEMEALILENNLIKKYMPRYNVLLRDDKTYPYIALTTAEKYPRVFKTRRIEKDCNRYFGPYSDAGAVSRIVEMLNRIYRLKRCNGTSFPADHRPCLNYQIGECRGVCTGRVDAEEYRASVREIEEFLTGKNKKLSESLKTRMASAAEDLRFEEAALLRDLITDVETLRETQRAESADKSDLDIVLPVVREKTKAAVLFTVRGGKMSGREVFPLQALAMEEERELTGAFINQYYERQGNLPPEIVVEELPQDAALLEEYLSGAGHKVSIIVPKRGGKAALLAMARQDRAELAETLEQKAQMAREKRTALKKALDDLLREVNLLPRTGEEEYRIESYDISNTNGVDSVGGMVVFQGLRKLRKEYRRFRIKTVEGPDDTGSLQEMIYRRFTRAEKGDPAFAVLPDMIWMDGGLGQVHAATQVLEALKVSIPVFGLAKDEHHRTRAMVLADGREIDLKKFPLLFRYAGTIQEEVHRFAIAYHHKLHGKQQITSVLDEIRGIGPARRGALLESLGSVEKIKRASVQELAKVPGMTEKSAQAVFAFFHR